MERIVAQKVNFGERNLRRTCGKGGDGWRLEEERDRQGEIGVGQRKYVGKKRPEKSEIDEREKQEETRKQKTECRGRGAEYVGT